MERAAARPAASAASRARERIDNEAFWDVDCDILIPAALEGQITAGARATASRPSWCSRAPTARPLPEADDVLGDARRPGRARRDLQRRRRDGQLLRVGAGLLELLLERGRDQRPPRQDHGRRAEEDLGHRRPAQDQPAHRNLRSCLRANPDRPRGARPVSPDRSSRRAIQMRLAWRISRRWARSSIQAVGTSIARRAFCHERFAHAAKRLFATMRSATARILDANAMVGPSIASYATPLNEQKNHAQDCFPSPRRTVALLSTAAAPWPRMPTVVTDGRRSIVQPPPVEIAEPAPIAQEMPQSATWRACDAWRARWVEGSVIIAMSPTSCSASSTSFAAELQSTGNGDVGLISSRQTSSSARRRCLATLHQPIGEERAERLFRSRATTLSR